MKHLVKYAIACVTCFMMAGVLFNTQSHDAHALAAILLGCSAYCLLALVGRPWEYPE